MSKLNLIVKGNQVEAEQAAAARSIPFTFQRSETFSDGRQETIGQCPDNLEFAVQAWFNEPGEAPFETGTLLVWSHIDRVKG